MGNIIKHYYFHGWATIYVELILLTTNVFKLNGYLLDLKGY